MFHDEGAGKYNPAPQILDEAVVNEWPGRELGVFVSIGTGKRPPDTNKRQHEWWEDFLGETAGNFAEARRRLMVKIEGCEQTHQFMLKEHLAARGASPENYYRLNVEVGVGEFGMNEWNRVAEISTNTRQYLNRQDVKAMTEEAAAKMARIERMRRRYARDRYPSIGEAELDAQPSSRVPPPLDPRAAELPGDEGHAFASPNHPPYPRYSTLSDAQDKFAVVPDASPNLTAPTSPAETDPPRRRSAEKYRPHIDSVISNSPSLTSPVASVISPLRLSHEGRPPPGRTEPPPLPPKMPLGHGDGPAPGGGHPEGRQGGQHPDQQGYGRRPGSPGTGASQLPYPDEDGPPPVVNMARKPEYVGR
jgi:hypothetical protein